MRILLTSHCDPETIGGTQSFNATLAAELERRGHWPTIIGRPEIASWAQAHDAGPYQLGIVSQCTSFAAARRVCDRLLFVSHGLDDLEKPDPMADAVACVSEEVQRRWWDIPFVGHTSVIVRNPIDTERFCPAEQDPEIDVLRLSTHGGLGWLPHICARMGLTFHHARDTSCPERWIQRARIVVATGRSCYEAMSCGKEVLIMDERPYNSGPLYAGFASAVYFDARTNNCSGRTGSDQSLKTQRDFEADLWLATTPDKRNLAARNRDLVVAAHDVRDVAGQLLELAA